MCSLLVLLLLYLSHWSDVHVFSFISLLIFYLSLSPILPHMSFLPACCICSFMRVHWHNVYVLHAHLLCISLQLSPFACLCLLVVPGQEKHCLAMTYYPAWLSTKLPAGPQTDSCRPWRQVTSRQPHPCHPRRPRPGPPHRPPPSHPRPHCHLRSARPDPSAICAFWSRRCWSRRSSFWASA